MATLLHFPPVRHLLRWVLLPLLVLLALSLIAGRLMMGAAEQYRSTLESVLSEPLPYDVSIGRLKGDWRYFWPILHADQVVVSGAGGAALRLDTLELELDLLASLLNRTPVARRVLLDGLDIALWRSANGDWQLAGAGPPAEAGPLTAPDLMPLLQGLWLQREVTIRNARLTVTLRDRQQVLPVSNLELAWQHRFGRQRLYARIGVEDQEHSGITLRGESRGSFGETDFRARYYLRTSLLQQQWWQLLLPRDPRFPSQLALAGEAWGELSGTAQHHIRAELSVPTLDWQLGDELLAFRDLAAQLQWQRDAEGWQSQVSALAGRLDQQPLGLTDLYFAGDGPLPSLIASSSLDLARFWGRMIDSPLLSEGLRERLRPLNPSGQLRNLQLRLPAGGDIEAMELQADLDQVAVGAWKGAPEAGGVSGRLKANRDGGRVDLDSDRFWLNFPELYRQGWQFDHASGVVRWQRREDSVRVESDLLSLGNAQVSANGRFRVDIPNADRPRQEGRLVLMIGMQQSDGALAPLFVPDRIVKPALFQWLEGALNQGDLRYGGLVYDAPLKEADGVDNNVALQMFFDTTAARVRYQQGWPVVHDADAFTLIKGGEVLVQIPKGRVYEQTRIEQAEVYLPAGSQTLEVRARMNGPAADGRLALLESPIGHSLGEEFARWQLQGQLHTELNLGIDLQRAERSRIRVDTHVDDGQYWSEGLNLRVDDIEGSIHYHERKGLYSGMISGRFFDRPLAAQIDTLGEGDRATTRVRGWGGITMDSVRQWTGLPLMDAFSGETDYSFELGICGYKPGCSALRLDSKLLGVSFDAPQPFAKRPGYAAPFSAKLALTSGRQWLRLEHPQLQALLGLEAGTFLGGELGLGAAPATLDQRTDGVKVVGQLQRVDLDEWRTFIERHFLAGGSIADSGAAGDSDDTPLLELDLRADQVDYDGNRLTAVDAHLLQQPDRWWLSLTSDQATGMVTLPKQSGKPYVAELSHLYLPPSAAESEFPVDPLSDFDPRTLVPLNLSVEDLRRGDQQFGRWRLRIRPDDSGASFEQVQAQVRGLDLAGELRWDFNGQEHHTDLTLDASAGDLGAVMESWGSARSMETQAAAAAGHLGWNGTPAGFNWARLNGDFSIDAQKGRLFDTGDRQVVKLFSLFNMNTLLRRLSLDFTDLSTEGTTFDSMHGRFAVSEGVARTTEPATVISPTYDLELNGSIDLVREQLDMDMLVQLPVAENLPIAAVFLASPAIAGAAFLVERLIGKKLKRFTSVKYHLSGPWGNPEMKALKAAPKPEADYQPIYDNH